MSQDEIAVMDGSKCILQVRGVRPFLSTKYDIEKHHNYQYLADSDPKKAFDIVEFVNVFKENKAKLLEGLNKKNTKHVKIDIGEDDDVQTEAVTEEKPTNTPVSATPIVEPVTTKQAEPTKTVSNQIHTPEPKLSQNDNRTGNYEDEDDENDFDPDDTEIV